MRVFRLKHSHCGPIASKEAVVCYSAAVADTAGLIFAYECFAEVCLRILLPELSSTPFGVDVDRATWIAIWVVHTSHAFRIRR